MPLFMVDDFSGGFTDRYLEGDPRYAKKVDNFVLNDLNELVQRPGIGIFDDIIKQNPAGNQRFDSIFYFDNTVFAKSSTRLYYWESGDTSWSTLDGPSSVHAFAGAGLYRAVTWSVWRGHVFACWNPYTTDTSGGIMIKLYRNSSGNWTCIQAGLPRAADGSVGGTYSPPTITVGSSTLVYYRWYHLFVHEYVAQVNGENVTFKDYGTPNLVDEGAYNTISGSNNTYLGYLDYTNGTNEKYPTSDMEVETFRTVGGGYIPKYAETDALGVDVVDDNPDEDLGAPLYTGDLRNPITNNDPPPKAFYTELVDNRMVFFGAEDIDGSFESDRVMESKVNDLDSVPATNYTRLDDTCTGGGRVGVYPIGFTLNKTYRIEGHFDSRGGGYMRPRLISESEGCVDSNGIVRHKDFLLFVSLNGICWTDGFKVINLTQDHLSKTFSQLVAMTGLCSCFDHKNQRAIWAFRNNSFSEFPTRNNQYWVLDLQKGLSERGVFTTWTSKSGHYPYAFTWCEDEETVVMGNLYGYIYGFDEDQAYDLVQATTGDLDTHDTIGILTHYISSAIRSGRGFKVWLRKVFSVFKNTTGDISVEFEGYNDDSSSSYSLLDFRQRSVSGLHLVRRMWRRLKRRAHYASVGMKKSEMIVLRSDDENTATISGTTVSLDGGGSWPNVDSLDLVNYSIYFEGDSYATGYEIEAQSGTNLTVDSAPGNASNQKWVIKGLLKSEVTEMESIAVDFGILGESIKGKRASDDGANS